MDAALDWRRSERGATAVEYGLLIAVIAASSDQCRRHLLAADLSCISGTGGSARISRSR